VAETNEQLRSKLDQAYRATETNELELYAAIERYQLAKLTMLSRYGETLGLDGSVGPRAALIAAAHRELGELAARMVLAQARLDKAQQVIRNLRERLLYRRHRR
jgi:hypothetical protein